MGRAIQPNTVFANKYFNTTDRSHPKRNRGTAAEGRRQRNATLFAACRRQVWDVASGQCIHALRGHNDEILDVSFNATGSKLVTASADGTSRVFNTMNGACQAILIGHEGEISKVVRLRIRCL